MEYPSLDKPTAGAFRFNTDSSQLEIYDGNQWTGVLATSPEQLTGGTRGFIVGGYTNAPVSAYGEISYYNINTTGGVADFGDTIATGGRTTSTSSRTRGLTFWANAPAKNTIEYVTMQSLGNAVDFGDMVNLEDAKGACSDSTRAVIAGGYPNNPDGSSSSGPYTRTNVIQYITIAQTGNALDFGDLAVARSDFDGCSNPTRGIFMAGGGPSPSASERSNVIDYITIQTTGNSTDFGDLTDQLSHTRCGSNAVRGIRVTGIDTTPSTTAINSIDYVAIATLGNAVDFGDAASTVYSRAVSASSTRLVSACGGTPVSPYNINAMDYIQIATTGNAIDFGDGLPAAGLEAPVGFSNGHGGLG